MLLILLTLLIAYLVGSIPSAILVAKILGLPDPRTQGSQNPGATNMLRIGGKRAGIIVLVGDYIKGMIPVITAKLLGLPAMALGFVALAVVLGHIFPVFFGFKGGKGVATAAGALTALCWPLAIATVVTWLIVAILSRYSSLAAITAITATPLYGFWLAPNAYWVALLLICVLLLWRHQENIKRLLKGTETKLRL